MYFEEDDWTKRLLIAKFVYNNAKNASTGCTPFELNYDYQSRISYKKDIYSRSRSKIVEKLLSKLGKLMIVCRENIYYT